MILTGGMSQGFPGFGFGEGGFHMSFGIGAFPFGFFSSTFQVGDRQPQGKFCLWLLFTVKDNSVYTKLIVSCK